MVWISAGAALLLFSVSLVAWMRWVHWVYTPRLDQQLSVATGGKFEAPVRIPISGRYDLWIYFSRKGVPEEKLFALVGAPLGEPPGLAIPLRWSLQQTAPAAVVALGESNAVGTNAGSADEFGRLLQKLKIKAGRYTFKGELPQAVPEFKDIRVRLMLVKFL